MKSWKTTVAGILAGSIPILQQLYELVEHNQPVNWTLVLIGFSIMLLGVVSKDFDVSGGSR